MHCLDLVFETVKLLIFSLLLRWLVTLVTPNLFTFLRAYALAYSLPPSLSSVTQLFSKHTAPSLESAFGLAFHVHVSEAPTSDRVLMLQPSVGPHLGSLGRSLSTSPGLTHPPVAVTLVQSPENDVCLCHMLQTRPNSRAPRHVGLSFSFLWSMRTEVIDHLHP